MASLAHLLLETPRSNLSVFVGPFLTSYTGYFNSYAGRARPWPWIE